MIRILFMLLGLVYITLLGVGVYVGSLMVSTIAKSEDLTTSNLTPGMENFTRSGGTSVGQGWGCSSGQYCTSGTNEGGGTYSSTFDVPLTEAEVRQGFTLNSGITVNSHSSNSRLASCTNGVLQSGDCRDIFKLTITLKDGNTVVETFIHQEELDWTGIANFTYSDTVASNSYGVLSGVLSLYGIDAGYPVGYYGPQFSDPSLTIDYQTALVVEDTTTVINDVIQTETENTIMDVATVEPEVVPVTTTIVSTTLPVFQTYTTSETTETQTPVVTPVVTTPVTTTASVSEATIEAPVVEPAAPAAPTIAPVAQQSETQQAETQQAEAEIENSIAPTPAAKEQPQKAKVKSKTPRKTVTTTTTTVAVPVVVTPAVAAQTVVNNIAPSQKYGNNAQTVTLVAMGMIANNRGLFKGATIPDVPKFFNNSSVPDGPSMVDRMTNYQVFGQSNGLHNQLVESQWSK
jgi:hypothetical protein